MSKTLPPESTFVHELRQSLEHYAAQDGGSASQSPTVKIQGSAAMSSLPDIFGYYKGKHFWMECKRREIPKRKFNLMAGLSPGQRTVLRSWTMASATNSTFLAVRLGYDVALVVDFGKTWADGMAFPPSIMIQPDASGRGKQFKYLLLNPFVCVRMIVRKPRGLWENIGAVVEGNVIGGGENE